MKIVLLCVGKLREKYLKEAAAEYCKRLSTHADVRIIEVPDERGPEKLSKAEKGIILLKEGNRLLEKIPPDNNGMVVTLEIKGKPISSEKFSSFFREKMNSGISTFCFIIGGSTGLSPEVSSRSDLKLSLSAMTYPHQLTRIILLEQIFRSFKIMKNEPYHK
jgi:23S rRNA (pseudouridine1915-N3)-methyltransferase